MRLPSDSVQLLLLLLAVCAALSTETLGWIARCALLAYVALILISFLVPPYRGRCPLLLPAPSSFVLLSGCTSGLGLASSRLFASRGWNVLLLGRDGARLEALRSELADRYPGQQFETLVQDLAVQDADRLVVRQLRQKGFRVDEETETEAGEEAGSGETVAVESTPPAAKYVDVLVNNAGVGLVKLFLSTPRDTLQRMISLHVAATTGLSRALLPAMLARGRGRVANVSSMIGAMPSPRSAVYAATKAFLHSFTNSLAYEVALRVDALAAQQARTSSAAAAAAPAPLPNVAVVLVAPGATHTQFAATADAESSLVFRVPGLAQSGDSAARQMVDGILEGRRVVQPGLLTRLISFTAPKFPSKLAHFVVFFLWGTGDVAADFGHQHAAQSADKKKER